MDALDADALTLIVELAQDLQRAVEDLTQAVQGLTSQIAVRVITVKVPESPLPSIQQDER